MRTTLRLLVAFGLTMISAAARIDAATIQLVTYNTEGLPPFPPIIPDRTAQIAQMPPLLEGLHGPGSPAILALQEVFFPPFFSTLTDPNVVSYPEITAKDTGGSLGIGDGLTLMSDATIDSFTRTQWTDCFGNLGEFGSDCATNKGFLHARITLAPGAEIDLYDLHADAGQDPGSQLARLANINQLATAISTNSAGHAVIVLGDTNSLYSRSTDNVGTLLASVGLTDAWIELANNGVVPGFGPLNNSGCPAPRGPATGSDIDASGPACELVDKIFYRSGGQVQLTLLDYEVLLSFVDGSGTSLSDHLPVSALFDYVVLTPEPAPVLLLLTALAIAAGRRRRA